MPGNTVCFCSCSAHPLVGLISYQPLMQESLGAGNGGLCEPNTDEEVQVEDNGEADHDVENEVGADNITQVAIVN